MISKTMLNSDFRLNLLQIKNVSLASASVALATHRTLARNWGSYVITSSANCCFGNSSALSVISSNNHWRVTLRVKMCSNSILISMRNKRNNTRNNFLITTNSLLFINIFSLFKTLILLLLLFSFYPSTTIE